MKSFIYLITKNIIAFTLSYLTYNALYVLLGSIIVRNVDQTFLEGYQLMLSQSFIVVVLPFILLIIIFNLLIIAAKNRLYPQPVVKRTIWLTLIGGVLGFVGYAVIHLLSTNNVWIIDLPTLLLLAGIFFGFFYSLLSPKRIKV